MFRQRAYNGGRARLKLRGYRLIVPSTSQNVRPNPGAHPEGGVESDSN